MKTLINISSESFDRNNCRKRISKSVGKRLEMVSKDIHIIRCEIFNKIHTLYINMN